MYISDRYLSAGYKAAVFFLSGLGLALNFGLPGQFNFGSIKYYTILSNVLCFVFFGAALFTSLTAIQRDGRRGECTLLPRFKGAVTIAITVTMLIYQFILSDTPFSMGPDSGGLGNHLVHLIVPLLVILDWLLFDPKGRYRPADPFFWCLLPMVYWLYTFVGALLGVTYGKSQSRYPYGFIDVDKLGLARVVGNVAALLLFFLALCYVIFALDRLLSRVGEKKSLVKR